MRYIYLNRPEDFYWNIETAAKVLGMSEAAVIEKIKSGEIKGCYNPPWAHNRQWYVEIISYNPFFSVGN